MFLAILPYISVFVACFFMETFLFIWNDFLSDKQAVHAANTSFCIFLVSSFITINFISNHWLLIPGAFGWWLGTWVAVINDVRKLKPQETSELLLG